MITMMIMNDLNNPALFEHRTYGTGDQIWICLQTGKVVKVITHDGLEWDEEGKTRRVAD